MKRGALRCELSTAAPNQPRSDSPDLKQKQRAPKDEAGGWDAVNCGGAMACGLLAVYAATVYPSVAGGDSGELLAEACHLGTAHPPGYPLYTMLAKGAMMLPGPGTPAYKANLLSAVLTSGAAFFIFLAAATCRPRDRSGGVWWCAVGPVSWALSRLTWEYAITAEVFALNNFLVALLLYLTARVWRWGQLRDAYWGALVCGLALANQHTSLLFVAALVPCVLWRLRRAIFRSPFPVLFLASLFLMGLSPYAYLYIAASRRATPGSWGDLTTMQGLVKHVLRSEYGTLRLSFAFADEVEGAMERTMAWAKHLWAQTRRVVPCLALLGIALALIPASSTATTSSPPADGNGSTSNNTDGAKEQQSSKSSDDCWKGFTVVVVAALTLYTVVWNGLLSNIKLSVVMAYGVHARFWMQPDLAAALLAGIGADSVSRAALPQWMRSKLGLAPVVAVAAALLRSNYKTMDRSQDGWTLHRYAESLLYTLPSRSILVSHTDLDWNTVRYLQVCEGKRPDVAHLTFQLMPYPWFERQRHLPQYRDVVFPALPPHPSTHRLSDANAQLVSEFVRENLSPIKSPDGGLAAPKYPGGVYLDLMSINDAQFGAAGTYRNGLRLVPWGMLYKSEGIEEPRNIRQSEKWHAGLTSRALALMLNTTLPSHTLRSSSSDNTTTAPKPFAPAPVDKYPSGTWEFAAASQRGDGVYQAGLYLLTYAMEVSKPKLTTEALEPFVEALRNSAAMLAWVLEQREHYGTVTANRYDVLKNTVLAHARLQHAYQVLLRGGLASHSLGSTVDGRRLTVSEEELEGRARTSALIKTYMREYPDDKDVPVFRKMMEGIEAFVVSAAKEAPKVERAAVKKEKVKKKTKKELLREEEEEEERQRAMRRKQEEDEDADAPDWK